MHKPELAHPSVLLGRARAWSLGSKGLPILEPSALITKLLLYLYSASGAAPSGVLFQSC